MMTLLGQIYELLTMSENAVLDVTTCIASVDAGRIILSPKDLSRLTAVHSAYACRIVTEPTGTT